MAERLDIVSQSNFPTNKSNTVEIVTTTKKKVTTASASDIATLVTPAISNLDIATQTNFPIQESDAQSDFIITTDGGVNNVTAEAAAGLISSYIPTGGSDPHEPDFTEDYSTNYSDFSNFTGSGTEADPYQIWNEKMFLNARFKVNNGGITANTYFRVMRDFVWQFDGLGFGTFLDTFTIYDANNQSLGTANYGASTYQSKLFFDGGNCTITINNNGFVFNDAFIANTLGITEYDHFSTTQAYILLFNCKTVKNLNLNFTGSPLTTDNNRGWRTLIIGAWITYQLYGSSVDNCKVENLKLNSKKFYFGDVGVIGSQSVNNCIVRNFEQLADESLSGGIIHTSNGPIKNCLVENVNIYHGYPIYNSELGGLLSAVVDNCTIRNIHFRIQPSDVQYNWACCVYSVVVKNTKIEDVFAGNKQSIHLFNLSQYSSDTSKTVYFNNNSVSGNINGIMSNENQKFFAVYFPNSQNGCKFESNNFLCDALFNVDQKNNNFTIDTTNHNWFSPLDAEVATLNNTIVNGKLTTVANI